MNDTNRPEVVATVRAHECEICGHHVAAGTVCRDAYGPRHLDTTGHAVDDSPACEPDNL